MVAQIIFLLTKHYLVELHKPVCFVFSFVGSLMQSLKQRAAIKKHLYNQSCHYATLEDSLVKVLAPMCCATDSSFSATYV